MSSRKVSLTFCFDISAWISALGRSDHVGGWNYLFTSTILYMYATQVLRTNINHLFATKIHLEVKVMQGLDFYTLGRSRYLPLHLDVLP